MLNRSHPLSRYKANSGKNNKNKCLMHFDPQIGSFSLAINTKYKFVTNFYQ